MDNLLDQNSNEDSLENRISILEISGVLLGVDIVKSREVFPVPNITPVPNTREFVVGVFNLRSEIYPLINISTILGLEPKTLEKSDMVMLLEEKGITMGILADRIHGVQPINNTSIKQAHGIVSKTMEEFVTGVISDKSSEVYLLDTERLFTSSSITRFY